MKNYIQTLIICIISIGAISAQSTTVEREPSEKSQLKKIEKEITKKGTDATAIKLIETNKEIKDKIKQREEELLANDVTLQNLIKSKEETKAEKKSYLNANYPEYAQISQIIEQKKVEKKAAKDLKKEEKQKMKEDKKAELALQKEEKKAEQAKKKAARKAKKK